MRTSDSPRSELTKERSWPNFIKYKLGPGEKHPPSGPAWYYTAPQRLSDRIEAETLSMWRELAAEIVAAAYKEDQHVVPERCLAAVECLITQDRAYHSVTEVLEKTAHCTSEVVVYLRAKARDCARIFNRIENLRLALRLHDDAASDLADSAADVGEHQRRMTEGLAWLVVESYNLGSLARLVGLRPLEDAVLDGRKPQRAGGRRSRDVRRKANAVARQKAIKLAESYTGSKASLVSYVTRTLESNGPTHLRAGKPVPYSKDAIRDWLKKAGQL